MERLEEENEIRRNIVEAATSDQDSSDFNHPIMVKTLDIDHDF